MTPFYKNTTNNLWYIGNTIIPASTTTIELLPNDKVRIKSVEESSRIYYDGLATLLTNYTGTAYTSTTDLLNNCADFFVKAETSKTTITAFNTISVTTISSQINTFSFNACLISALITGTGTWNIKIQGKFTSDGTFMDIYDNVGDLLSTGNISANQIQMFVGLPTYIQIVATEITDGSTLTCKVQLINV